MRILAHTPPPPPCPAHTPSPLELLHPHPLPSSILPSLLHLRSYPRRFVCRRLRFGRIWPPLLHSLLSSTSELSSSPWSDLTVTHSLCLDVSPSRLSGIYSFLFLLLLMDVCCMCCLCCGLSFPLLPLLLLLSSFSVSIFLFFFFLPIK